MDVWPFIPQQGLTESLEWLTDVIRCKAAESRTSLRLGPRHGYQFNSQLDSREYARAKTLSRNFVGELEVPMWPHLVNVGDVLADASIVPGNFDPELYDDRVILWESSEKWEVLVVASAGEGLAFTSQVTRTYYNALVAPLITAFLSQSIDFRSVNGGMWISNIRTASLAALQLYPAIPPVQHRGHDVLTDPNILISSLVEKHHRETDSADSRTGVMAQIPRYSAAESKSTMSWKPVSKPELLTFLKWIHSRRGRRHAFWYVSHNQDLSPQSALGLYLAGTDKVEVSVVSGLTLPLDIRILNTTTGESLYYSVQSLIPVGSNLRLVLTGNSGVTWPQEAMEISFMVPVRFDSDRLEIKHASGGSATMSVPITEVPNI